jgi:hypothetical protein
VPRSIEPAGFALAEACVASALFVVIAVGVAPLFLVAAGARTGTRDQTMTAMLAAAKLESLASLAFTWSISGGIADPVTDQSTDLASSPEGRSGHGLSPSPPGALLTNTGGYVDFLDEQGNWAGSGPEIPPGAYFVRRWAVAPAPADPDHTLMLFVMAATLRADARAARTDLTPRAGDTWLFGLRARVAP